MTILFSLIFLIFSEMPAGKQTVPSTYSGTQSSLWTKIDLDTTTPYKYIQVTLTLKVVNEVALAISENFPLKVRANKISAHWVDYDGWYSNSLYHSILLDTDEISSDLIIGVSNFKQSDLEYSINITGSDTPVCPFGCLGNGKCSDKGTCECHKGHVGKTCEFSNELIAPSISQELLPGDQIYLTIEEEDSDDGIEIIFTWSGYIAMDIDYENNGYFLYRNIVLPCVEESEFSAFFLGRGTTRIPIKPSNKDILIHIQNRDNSSKLTITIKYSLIEETDEEQHERTEAIRLIVLIAGICPVVILVTLCLNFCKCIGLGEQTVDDKRAARLKGKYKKSVYQTLTTANTETCVICFEVFTPRTEVIELECRHLFHPRCIYEWFKSSATCCVCKKDCSVPLESEPVTGMGAPN